MGSVHTEVIWLPDLDSNQGPADEQKYRLVKNLIAACWRAYGTPIGLGGGLARKGVRFLPETRKA